MINAYVSWSCRGGGNNKINAGFLWFCLQWNHIYNACLVDTIWCIDVSKYMYWRISSKKYPGTTEDRTRPPTHNSYNSLAHMCGAQMTPQSVIQKWLTQQLRRKLTLNQWHKLNVFTPCRNNINRFLRPVAWPHTCDNFPRNLYIVKVEYISQGK